MHQDTRVFFLKNTHHMIFPAREVKCKQKFMILCSDAQGSI